MATGQLDGVIQHLRSAMLLREAAGLTDGQLLRDYISRRDEADFAALVQRHGPMVWGVCRRVLDNHYDAEDAFQATFLVLVRRAATIASPGLLANWLYGVAHQTARKARATVAKRKVRERQVADMPEPAVVEQDLWNELQPLLDQELSRLPDRYRAVIVLCDLEGKTRSEAARHLGVPEGTVGSRMARARVMLAKRLARRGVVLSAGALAAVLLQNVASAAMPTSLADSAIKVAATGAISVKVAALAEGVMKAMLFTKLKAALVVVLALGFFVTGATVLTYRTAAAQSDQAAAAEEPVATPQKKEQKDKKEDTTSLSKEVADLQGEWRMVAAEWDGEKIPTDYLKGRKWVVKGNEITVDALVFEEGRRKPGTSIDKLRFRLNPGKTPKEIDLTPRAGISKGTTTTGIYVIEGRRLRVCFVWVGEKGRPKEFKAPAGSGFTLITLEKEAFTAWGKEVDGLQAGVTLVNANRVHIGEKADLLVKLRNVSKAPIKVAAWPLWLYPPGVVDATGKPVRATRPSMPLFEIIPKELTLPPGQTVDLAKTYIHVAGLREDVRFPAGVVDQFTIHVLPGKYKAHLEGFLQGRTALSTGTVELEIKSDPPPATEAAQDTKPILDGSKAGDRKELVPGIAFRWCPAGKFKMGEGHDAVDVELSKGFWLGETEVTQAQWKKLMGTSPWSGRMGVGARASTDNTPPKEGPDYAASYINYDDALSFCKKLTAQEQAAGRLPKAWKYSLPTEAQWEYACRAGTKTKFSFGDDESQLSQYAWFGDDSGKEPYARQVGLKKPNAWGLCDMHGNVWEWCNDWYVSKRTGGKDPVGPTTLPPPVPPPPLPDGTPGPPDATSARNRVVRGGSWVDNPLTCTSASRFYAPPDRGGNSVQGFRLAAVPAGQDDNKPMTEKPVEPAAKKAKDAKESPWGEAVGGWRMRLTTPSGTEYRGNTPLALFVELQNVSDEPLSLGLLAACADPEVTADGKRLITRTPIDLSPWEGRRDQLPAGASIKWMLDFDRLRFATQPLKAGTDLRVRFRLAMQGETSQGKPDAGKQRLLFSNEVSLKLKDDHPSILSGEAGLPAKWTNSTELVYREHVPLLGYEALRIDGKGRAWLVSVGRGKGKPPAAGPIRTEVVLKREDLDRLAKFLRDQKLWELPDLSQAKIPAPDEGEIRLSIGAGRGSLVGSVPNSSVRGQPKLQALQAEMAKVMAVVREQKADDERKEGSKPEDKQAKQPNEAPGALMSEQPAWGKPLDGLRLGLYQTDPKGDGRPSLTVVLENVGTENLVLILGKSWARGKKHQLGAIGLNLTTAEGMLKRSYDLRPKGSKRDDLADGAVAGPFVVQLVAGGRYTISSDLHDYYDPKDVDAVLAPGKYRVAAKFVGQDYLSGWKGKTDKGPRTWLDIMTYWTGTIESGVIQVTMPAKPPT